MTIEVIHDQFVISHLIRFYDGSVVKDKEFRHRSEPGAEIVLTKMLMNRWRVKVSAPARALLVKDARDWALSDSVDRRVIGTQVYQYLTATAGIPVV